MYRIKRMFRRAFNLLQYYRFAGSIHPTDVFIVSYPKSGTTWLAFLVANVLKERGSEQIHLLNSTKYVPDVNKVYLKKKGLLEGSLKELNSLPDPRFFKVHALYDPRLPKVVYLLRDPRDVVVSRWHYKRMLDAEFCLALKDFIKGYDCWPCDWDEHVAGWLLDHEHPDLLLVTYEQMHNDAAEVLKRVLDFSGRAYTESDIARSVEASQVNTMRELEEEFGRAEGTAAQNERFVRKGKVSGWRDELDCESLLILEEKYAEVMERVGYELEG